MTANSVCFIAGCNKEAVCVVTVWPEPHGLSRPTHHVSSRWFPLCAEHLWAAEIKSEGFLKEHPIEAAL
jgi:hypothetical protein